jgi:hypothetical protein
MMPATAVCENASTSTYKFVVGCPAASFLEHSRLILQVYPKAPTEIVVQVTGNTKQPSEPKPTKFELLRIG